MSDRYDQDASLPNDDGLDEYLCEYVDGTMDPAVRRAFEDFLRANPALAAHVERLQRTRMLCSRQRCTHHAPSSLQHRLRMEIARDLMGNDGPALYLPRLGHFAAMTSLVGLAVLIGVVTGAALVDRRPFMDGGVSASSERMELPDVPSDAHGYPSAGTVRPVAAAAFGIAVPASALPVLTSSDAITPIGGCDSLAASAAQRSAAVTP